MSLRNGDRGPRKGAPAYHPPTARKGAPQATARAARYRPRLTTVILQGAIVSAGLVTLSLLHGASARLLIYAVAVAALGILVDRCEQRAYRAGLDAHPCAAEGRPCPGYAPQATPRRVAAAIVRGILLIATAVALLTWGAWQHHAGTCALACASIAIGLIGLYYAGVARGAL